MAQFMVRNFDDDLKRLLQQRAARRGRSMEEEVREILRAALSEPPAPVGLGQQIAARFAGLDFAMKLPELRGESARPMDTGR